MLPINQHLDTILATLSQHHALVLQAEPGAGKSTALPLSLLNADFLNGRKIVMLEPRRVAARTIAHYLAKTLNQTVGDSVGYQVRNDRKISSNTVLEIVTEGILTRRIQNDPELSDVGLLIFDEFHERSIHSDLGLLLARECQSLRDDLKILVMSATIDTQSIANYLEDCPVIECEGRQFPVSITYQAAHAQRPAPLSNQVLQALHAAILCEDAGDILIFLPGQADIRRCMTSAREQLPASLHVLELHGSLPLSAQQAVLRPADDGRQRLIFATNIAETSLTIDGIGTVIDSGLEKTARFDPQSGMTALQTTYISKASAKQRSGRAGRTRTGYCIRLWGESRQQGLVDFQPPEINNAELTTSVLELCHWGIRDIQNAPWLTTPPHAHINAALDLLRAQNFIDHSNKVSATGDKAITLGLPPRLAAMLLNAPTAQQSLASDIAAIISERDFLGRQHGSDFSSRLRYLHDYQAKRSVPQNLRKTLQIIDKTASKLLRRNAKAHKCEAPYNAELDSLLLLAYPDRLAKLRNANSTRYLLANGRGVTLRDDDALRGQRYLVVIDCDAQKSDGLIYSAITVDSGRIDTLVHDKLKDDARYRYDEDKNKIIGTRHSMYGAITLSSTPISNISAENFLQCIEPLLRTRGFSLLGWNDNCERWLARAQWLGQQIPTFPTINKALLLETADQWLLPYISHTRSIKDLKRVDALALIKASLSWEQQEQLERSAPTHYVTPSDKKIAIRYDAQQGPTVAVVLQEMFGQTSSPTIGGGNVAIRFELLSPAKRPIQTTSDLANFWASSYFEVAKDMRGRYPKHRWPDKPLLETPGKSIKPKNKQ